MELRHLRYFAKAAETLNFSDAAKVLNIAQSSLSQQIRQLEDELGIQLFIRNSHSIRLTEAGQVMLPFALRTIHEAQTCADRIHDLQKLLTGTLNIGVTHSFSPILTESVISFMKMYPGIKLNIVRKLNQFGCNVTVVPYDTPADTILSFKPDGLFLSNGPGDPEDVRPVIDLVRALRGRMSYDNYLVRLPVRRTDGWLEYREAMVPVSADVCVGDLPYTHENVAARAAKMRGEVYGWGGMLGGRDCSALVGDVYRCFGFRLPRDAAGLALLPGAEDVSALSTEEKRAALCTLPVGTILCFPGHVMLSWGTENGEPQCLSAAGNFLPPGSAGGELRAVNTVAASRS